MFNYLKFKNFIFHRNAWRNYIGPTMLVNAFNKMIIGQIAQNSMQQ